MKLKLICGFLELQVFWTVLSTKSPAGRHKQADYMTVKSRPHWRAKGIPLRLYEAKLYVGLNW